MSGHWAIYGILIGVVPVVVGLLAATYSGVQHKKADARLTFARAEEKRADAELLKEQRLAREAALQAQETVS